MAEPSRDHRPPGAAVPLDAVYRDRYETGGNRIAFRDDCRAVTYTQLGSRVRRLATGLRAAGLRPGDRLLLVGDNSVSWVEADHACYAGSFVRTAVLPRLHPRELAQIAADAEPRGIVADAAWLAATGTDWLPDDVTIRIAIGDEGYGQWAAFEEVVAAGEDRPLPPDDPDAPRWLGYTSGTTGRPKGVVFTNRTLGAMIHGVCAEIPTLGSDDVALHSAPISHLSGGIAAAVVAAGGTNVLHRSFDVRNVLAAVATVRPTVLPMVPTQITMLLDALEEDAARGVTHDTSSVRLLVYAGSPIAPDRVAAAVERLGPVMLQFYGSSEAPFPISVLRPHEHTAEVAAGMTLPRSASAGRPSRSSVVRIVDDAGVDVGVGDVGEVLVRSAQLTPGYWRNPAATAELFDAEGFCRTGDAGMVDADGYLYLVDRKKDMIITGGFNVYPREVENVISALPGVRDVAVVGLPSERWGEQVTAFVTTHPGAVLTADAVTAACRDHLARFKVPKEIRFVDALPLNPAGKVSKRDLRERFWADRGRRL